MKENREYHAVKVEENINGTVTFDFKMNEQKRESDCGWWVAKRELGINISADARYELSILKLDVWFMTIISFFSLIIFLYLIDGLID